MDYESNCEGDSKTFGQDGKFVINIFYDISTTYIIITDVF